MTKTIPTYGSSSHSAPGNDTSTPVRGTRIALVLDRSGSMNAIREQALETFNEAIDRIRSDAARAAKTGLDTTLSVVTFNHELADAMVNAPAGSAPRLHPREYQPGGMTALNDAVGRGIDLIEEAGPLGEADAALVIVISDGMENSSRKVSQADLVERMQALEGTEKWTFSFLMANVDIRDLSRRLRTERSNYASWRADEAGARVARDVARDSVGDYMEDRLAGIQQKKEFFKKAERKQAREDRS
jgi:uncharacterized protein YegL